MLDWVLGCPVTHSPFIIHHSPFIIHHSSIICHPALVGLTRVELVTSSLSGTRSNQLSYKPMVFRKGDGTLFEHGSPAVMFQLRPVRAAARCARFAKRLHALRARLNPFRAAPQKGGDPTAGSPTVTLLRLHPNHHPHLRLTYARLRVQTAFMM